MLGFTGDQMEFEPLYAENEVDDVEVLPEEHNETSLWYSQPNLEFQLPVPEPIIPQENEFNPLFICSQGDTFTSLYIFTEVKLYF